MIAKKATTINNGVVSVGPTGYLYNAGFNNTAVITINTGGTLRLVSFTYGVAGGTGQLSDQGIRRVINGGTLGNITVNEVIAGTGGLIKTGNATLTLNAVNTYSGATTLAAGTIAGTGTIASAMTVQSGGTLTVGGATGTSTGTLTLNGTLTLFGNTLLRVNRDATSDTIAKTSGTLTYGGTLTLANVGSSLVPGDGFTLFPAGGYVGAQSVTISCGTPGSTIHFTTDGSTPTTASPVYSTAITVPTDTPSFTINAFATHAGLSDSAVATGIYGTITTVAAAPPSTIDGIHLALRQDDTQFIVADGAASVDPAISAVLTNGPNGNHNLLKSGLGTMQLSAVNAYTGTTTINAGTLAVTGTLAATAVTVASVATLDCGSNITGQAALGSSVTVNAGAHLAFHVAATSAAQVTRTISGPLTLSAGNLVDIFAAATPADGTYTLVTQP